MPRWTALFLLLWLSLGALHAQNSMDVLDDRHILVAGDMVSIRVLEDRRDAEQLKVPTNGIIQVRYVRAVKAEGLTCRKLAMLIRQKLVAMPVHRLPFTYSSDAGTPTVLVARDRLTCGFPDMDELDNTTKLKPGWTIGIRILEDKREKLQQVIAVTGEVQVPYIGLVQAAGMTCAELATMIKAELEKHFFQHAMVLVTLDYKGIEEMPNGGTIICFGCGKDVVSVWGNVAKTGKYDFPEDKELMVSSLLAMAGGHTSKKQVPTIKILRRTPQGNKMILVNSRAVLVDKSKDHNLFLRPGDVMFVE